MVTDKRFDREKLMGKHRKKSGNRSEKMKYVEVKDKLVKVAAKDIKEMEREFYENQMGERRMERGPIDLVEERKKNKLKIRQKAVEKQI